MCSVQVAAIMSGWDPSLFGLMWGVNGVPTGFFREGRGGIQMCMVHLQSLFSASLGHERVYCQGATGVYYT